MESDKKDPKENELQAAEQGVKKHMTYTKWAVTILLLISVLDVQFCFYLAYQQRSVPETVAVAMITEIIAVIVAYMAKAYFETKEEEKNRLFREIDKKREKHDKCPDTSSINPNPDDINISNENKSTETKEE